MIRYVLRRVLASLRDNPVVSAITISTLGGAAFVLGLVSVVLLNVEHQAERWTREAPVVAYLAPGASDRAVEKLVASVRGAQDVDGVTVLTPAEALARLRESMGERAWIFDGLEADNPLPTTLEVRLAEGPAEDERLRDLSERLSKLPGVDRVEGGGGWLEAFHRVRRWLRWASGVVALAVLSAVALVISNTIRLMVYGRMREVRILRIVGASDFLIRVPFMIEGAVYALAGLGFALGVLWGGLQVLARRNAWLAAVEFLPPIAIGALALVFIVLATVASLLSVQRCLDEPSRSQS